MFSTLPSPSPRSCHALIRRGALLLALIGMLSSGPDSAQGATIAELLNADSSDLEYYAKYRINPINPLMGRNPPITLKVIEDMMAKELTVRQDAPSLHLMMQAAFQYRMAQVAEGMSGWDALNTAIGLYHAYGEKYPLLLDSVGYWLELKNLYLTGRYYLSYDRAFTRLVKIKKDLIGADLACFQLSHEVYHPANTAEEIDAFYKDCQASEAIAFFRKQAKRDYEAFVANGKRTFIDLNDRKRFKP